MANKARRPTQRVRSQVYIPVPNEWLDTVDTPWTVIEADGSRNELSLVECVIYTLRACPVTNVADAERSLDILLRLKECLHAKPPNGEVDLYQDDFEWMVRLFRDHSWKIWRAPDAAYLCRYLAEHQGVHPQIPVQ